MKFLTPGFLYALTSLAIPIVIHLFHFRKVKKVRFSQLQFLKELQQRNQSRSKLKHLLVLLSRMLAISFLVFAFARPYIPISETQTSSSPDQPIAIYIDNSFSMAAKNEQGNLLDIAKNKAIEIIKAYPLGHQFIIIDNDFKNQYSRVVDSKKAIELSQNINLSYSTKFSSQVIQRIKGIQKSVQQVYLISDFQKISTDIENTPDPKLNYSLIPVNASKEVNLSLDSIRFSQATHFSNERLKEMNFSVASFNITDEREVVTELYLEQELVSPGNYSLEDKKEVLSSSFTIDTEKEWHLGKFLIQDYPITFDDTLYFNFKVENNLDVLHIYEKEKNKGISALFENDSNVQYQLSHVNSIDYSSFSHQEIIIIDELQDVSSGLGQEIKKYCDDGGKILIIPSAVASTSANQILSQQNLSVLNNVLNSSELPINEINTNSFLFQQVFESIPENMRFPIIKGHYKLDQRTRQFSESILKLQNGEPFLSYFPLKGNGGIYLFSAPLQLNESFIKNALFVPVLYNMAISGLDQRRCYYTLGENQIVLSHAIKKETPIYIKDHDRKIIPYQVYSRGNITIDLSEHQLNAGTYPVYSEDSLIDYISLNYNRKESDLNCFSIEELNDQGKLHDLKFNTITAQQNISQQLESYSIGKEFWKHCLLIALLFFGLEIILLRFLKS